MKRRFFHGIVLSILAVCLAGYLVGCPSTPQKVTVPSVVGMTQSAAQGAITGAGLAVGSVTEAFSASVPTGDVISQSPAAGASVAPASAVNLLVSKGPEPVTVTVPAVVGMTQTAAQSAITGTGLAVGSVTEAFSDSVPAGDVISQVPAAGTSVAPASAVNLLVSKGPEPVTVTVPAVVGMTQTAAQSAITGAGLAVGSVTEAFSDSVPAGDVISQNPAAGASVAPASAVNLVVSKGPEIEQQTVMLPGNVPLVMVPIPGGTFQMGRYPGEQDSFDGEDPQHTVTVPAFWMGKYELTKRQWKAVMGTEPWAGETYVLNDLDSPAVYISWNNAKAFIAALNTHTGLTFRLPSESEWEYAARAGTTTRFYWGDDPSYTVGDAYCWWRYNADDVGNRYAHVVGQKLPNAFGLYDMSGNAWEWCEDDWHSNYTGAPLNGSAWVDSARGSSRVLRGGGWGYHGNHCRSAYRGHSGPSFTYYGLGFRLSR